MRDVCFYTVLTGGTVVLTEVDYYCNGNYIYPTLKHNNICGYRETYIAKTNSFMYPNTSSLQGLKPWVSWINGLMGGGGAPIQANHKFNAVDGSRCWKIEGVIKTYIGAH